MDASLPRDVSDDDDMDEEEGTGLTQAAAGPMDPQGGQSNGGPMNTSAPAADHTGHTGLTQVAADLDISDLHIDVDESPTSDRASNALLPVAYLQDLVDQEILQHFDLVQAATTAGGHASSQISVAYPQNWDELNLLLQRLAYDCALPDPWAMLGFGPLAGPAPSEQAIMARTRTASLLCSLAQELSWPQPDKQRAATAEARFKDAGRQCEQLLPDVLMSRRALRAPKNQLPQWKELGGMAIAALRKLPHSEHAVFATQWSQVLDLRGDHGHAVHQHRQLADLLEKGDERALEVMKGKRFIIWAPSDTNALTRLIAAYMRKDAALSPTSILLLSPLPLVHGMDSAEQICDLWWHPLLSEQHAAITKGVHYIPQPMEFILPSRHGPQHVKQGPACFHISKSDPRMPPSIHTPIAPVQQVTAVNTAIISTCRWTSCPPSCPARAAHASRAFLFDDPRGVWAARRATVGSASSSYSPAAGPKHPPSS